MKAGSEIYGSEIWGKVFPNPMWIDTAKTYDGLVKHYAKLNNKYKSVFLNIVNNTSSRQTVTLFDGFSGNVLANEFRFEAQTISVGDAPRFLALNTNNNSLYISNDGDDTISVLNTVTNIVDTTISLANSPHNVLFNPDNNRIYVTNDLDDRITVIETVNDTVLSVNVVGDRPVGMDYSTSNQRIYIALFNDNAVDVYNPSTDSVDTTITGVGTTPRNVLYISSNNRIYVTGGTGNNVIVIDPTTNTIETTINVGNLAFGLDFNSSNNNLYVSNRDDNSISVINIDNNEVVDTITDSSFNDPLFIEFNANDNNIYVTNQSGNTVTVINSDNIVVDTITVGSSPRELRFVGSNNNIYVCNNGDDNVSRLGTTISITTPTSYRQLVNEISVNPILLKGSRIIPSNATQANEAITIRNITATGKTMTNRVFPRAYISPLQAQIVLDISEIEDLKINGKQAIEFDLVANQDVNLIFFYEQYDPEKMRKQQAYFNAPEIDKLEHNLKVLEDSKIYDLEKDLTELEMA